MKMAHKLLVLTITIVLLSIASPVTNAETLPPEKTRRSQATLHQILEKAVLYCLIDAKLHKPWVCYVKPEVGVRDRAVLARRLKRIDVTLVDRGWILSPKRPNRLCYVEIRDVEWLTPRRVRVPVFQAWDINPEYLVEAVGTVYLDYARQRWVVNKKDSRIEVGE